MRSRKVMKWLAAAAVGAMMLVPMTVSARTFDGMQEKAHEIKGTEAVNMAITVENKWDDQVGSMSGKTVVAQWTNTLTKTKSIILEISSDSSFPNDSRTYCTWIEDLDSYKEGLAQNGIDIAAFDGANTRVLYLNPGTNYVRAFIEETKEDGTVVYGPTSAVLTVNVPIDKIGITEQEVTENSVKFRFEQTDASGVEIQRKVGSKYKKVGKTTDNVFKDKGLEKGKTYSYRFRAYAYDASAGKNVYSEWTYKRVTTWGSNLKLQATPTGKKAVKLTWKKVKDADGYEIYREAEGTTGSEYKFSYDERIGYDDDYSAYELIKTIKSGKTKKYVDKKLDDGASYTYMVVAYKNENGKKAIMVEESKFVSLDFKLNVTEVVVNKDRTKTVKWQQVEGAEGYKVEKQTDYKDGKKVWTVVAQFPASQKSCVIPTSIAGDKYNNYRIYAFKGTENTDQFTVTAAEPAANDFPASNYVAATPRADGGVDVSWLPVDGADYYVVLRTTSLKPYKALTGQYEVDLNLNDYETGHADDYYPSADATPIRITTPGTVAGTTTWTAMIPKTNPRIVTDIYSTYAKNKDDKIGEVLNDGPQAGKTYYYYVFACKKADPEKKETKNKTSISVAYAKVTIGDKVALKKPAIKSIKSSKKGEVKLSWKKVAGAKAYYVYVKTGKKDYMCVGSTDKKNLTVSGLESGKSYTFKVAAAAVDAAGGETVATKGGTNKVKYSDAKSVKVK